MNLSTYRKAQKFLLASFCISVAVLTMTLFIIDGPADAVTVNGANNTSTANVNSPPPPANSTANKPAGEESNYSLMIFGVTFLTSITSLLGFISTTVLAWRKEKRDKEAIRYDNEKKELELEKLKWALEKLKAEEKESKPKRARKPKKTE
jgi:hypothetical protein